MNTNDNRRLPLSDLDKRISQLEERKRKILHTESEKERKARTKRLIETGALAEKYFNCSHLSIEEKEELFKIFSLYVNANMPEKFKVIKDTNTN